MKKKDYTFYDFFLTILCYFTLNIIITMIKAYKYRLYPTKEQEVLLSKHFGCVRFIYNWGLDFKTRYYKETNKNIGYMQIAGKAGALSNIKKENEWLKEVNSQSLVSALGNLDRAYTNFFNHISRIVI